MLSRQEVNTMRHLANAQYWDRPAGGNTGRLFLAFGGPVCADRFSNCPLDRVLTYKNLIYLLNLHFIALIHPIQWTIAYPVGADRPAKRQKKTSCVSTGKPVPSTSALARWRVVLPPCLDRVTSWHLFRLARTSVDAFS